jgi:hypothetical protein
MGLFTKNVFPKSLRVKKFVVYMGGERRLCRGEEGLDLSIQMLQTSIVNSPHAKPVHNHKLRNIATQKEVQSKSAHVYP